MEHKDLIELFEFKAISINSSHTYSELVNKSIKFIFEAKELKVSYIKDIDLSI